MSEIKDVIVRGCGKTTLRWSSCSAFVLCWRSRPLPLRSGFGTCDYAGTDANQPDHFDAASLDARRDPHSHLRDDHRLGGQRVPDADQRLRLWPVSIIRDFIPLIVTNCIVVGRAEAFAAKKVRRFRHWTAFQLVWAQPAPCSCWVHYAKLSAMARCLTVQMRC